MCIMSNFRVIEWVVFEIFCQNRSQPRRKRKIEKITHKVFEASYHFIAYPKMTRTYMSHLVSSFGHVVCFFFPCFWDLKNLPFEFLIRLESNRRNPSIANFPHSRESFLKTLILPNSHLAELI